MKADNDALRRWSRWNTSYKQECGRGSPQGPLGDGTERQEVWVDVTARGKADNSHGIPLRQICRQEAGSEEQQE